MSGLAIAGDNVITFEIRGDHPTLIESISIKLCKLGVSFRGDTESGDIRGKGFHVVYTITGKRCSLVVIKKPFYVPMTIIRSEVKSFVESHDK